VAFTKAVVALKKTGNAERRLLIRNQLLLGQIAWIGLFCVAIVAVAALGGASFTELVSFLLALVPQVVFGVGLWAYLSRSRKMAMTELLAVGVAIGPIAFGLCVLILLVVKANISQLLVAVILVAFGVCGTLLCAYANVRKQISVAPKPIELGVIGGSLVAAFLAATSLWARVDLPRAIQSWGTIGGDAAAEEARANSLMVVGLSDYLLADGQPLKYHIFGHVWSGAMHVVTNAGAFVTTTRLVPILTFTGTMLLTWVWIRALSRQDSAAVLAIVFLAIAGISSSLFGPLYLSSFSQSWGVFAGALFLVLWWQGQRGRLRLWWLSLGLAAFAMSLAKVNSLVFVAAAFVSALVLLVYREDQTRRPIVASTFAAALSLVAVLLFEYGYGNGVAFSLHQTAKYLGISSDSEFPLPIFLPALLSILLLITPWISAAVLAARDFPLRAQVLSFAGAACVMALGCTVFLAQVGQSQVYFSMTAGVVMIPLAAWGAIEAWKLPQVDLRVWLTVAGTSTALVVIWVALRETQTTFQVLSAYAVAAAGAALAAACFSAGHRRAVLAGGMAASVLTVSTFVLIGIQWVQTMSSSYAKVSYGPQSSNGISVDHIEAIEWLRKANVEQSLVATNFVCSDPSLEPPDCLAIAFPVAAIGAQPMFLEGFSYAAGLRAPSWALKRLELVEDLVRNRSDAAGRELSALGVEWVFVDKRRTTHNKWEPVGMIAYENSHAIVIRLE